MGKKKKHHDDHHGGAWKVAYADFVTAMMALFMVLWIVAQDDEIKIATSEYFQNPFNSPMDQSSGVMSGEQSIMSGESGEEESNSTVDTAYLTELANQVYQMLDLSDTLTEKPIDVQVTSDGLRILMYDRSEQPLFEEGSDELTEWGQFSLQNLAWIVDRFQFKVRIDGHASAAEQERDGDVNLWDLTADRANAARRSLQYYALDNDRIERVTGFADTLPLRGTDPSDESNRRLELSLSLGE